MFSAIGTAKPMNEKNHDAANPTLATAAAATLPGNGAPPPLVRAPLAYENSAFLNSADGRLMRIVSEYLEPLARFRH